MSALVPGLRRAGQPEDGRLDRDRGDAPAPSGALRLGPSAVDGLLGRDQPVLRSRELVDGDAAFDAMCFPSRIATSVSRSASAWRTFARTDVGRLLSGEELRVYCKMHEMSLG